MCLMMAIAVHAQSLVMDSYVPTDPQVWSFIKYGGQTPDLYTGTVRAEIPIYTYKDLDFEIPIALSYASNGYLPNMQANFVGLGWTLIAGGAITRTVNNIKDESEMQDSYSFKGFFRFSIQNNDPDINNRTIPEHAPFGYLLNNAIYETEPDLFFFNFPGHAGKFMFNDTGGTATVFDSTHPSGEYKVETTFQDNIVSQIFKPSVTITTGDGYKYIFGGLSSTGIDIHYYNYDEVNPSLSDDYNDAYSDSWVLSRIIAPNGRQVIYSYDIDQNNLVDESCHPYAGEESESTALTPRFFRGRTLRSLPVPRLSSITVMDSDSVTEVCVISFNYNTRTKEKYNRPGLGEYDLKNPGRLVSIQVHDVNDEQLLFSNLSYRYTGSSANPGNRVLLLMEVNTTGIGKYTMEYYNQDLAFPYHGCTSIDHWGYWNNVTPSYDALFLIPNSTINETTNVETISSSLRDPNAEVAVSGMLKKMTYPTGGWTEYSYEPHQAQKKIIKDGTYFSQGVPVLKTEADAFITGGLRVHSVTDHTDNNVSVTKEYLYTDNFGLSSGILYHTPRYRLKYHIVYNYIYAEPYYLEWTSTSYPAIMLDRNYVGYSQVTEKYADRSRRISRFLSYEDIQDVSVYDALFFYTAFEHYGSGISAVTPNYAFPFFRDAQSLDRCRGKVKQVDVYNQNGALTDKTTYQYSLQSAMSKKIGCMKTDLDSVYVYNNYVGDYSLTSETRTEYSSSGTQPVATTTSYTYNSLGQLKKRSVTTSDNAIYDENYIYVEDISGTPRTAAQDTMISRNILSPFIYKTLSVIRPGLTGARLIEGTKQDHSLYVVAGRQLPVVTKVSSAVVLPTYTYTSPYALTWNPTFTVTDVNYYGRPMEVKDANGIYTTLFWGYGGMYPVARLENCRVSQASAAAHSSLSRFSFGWSGMSDSEAATFRSIPGTLLTHWKYQPLIGVTEVTDPSGRKTSYIYNSHGHLTRTTGPDGNKIVEYDYSVDR